MLIVHKTFDISAFKAQIIESIITVSFWFKANVFKWVWLSSIGLNMNFLWMLQVLSLNDFINHKTAKCTVRKQFTNEKVLAINVNNILNLR